MSILHLPEEIMIMILRLLDIQSQHNVYKVNNHFKNLVSLHGVVNSCKFSLNTMATGNSLKLEFFKDVAGHIRELDLRAVNDLTKTSLIPAIKKLKQLQSLDVSYTKINIVDLLEVHQICPSLKNISINFVFEKNAHVIIPIATVQKCQKMFECFERIHFVGTLANLLYSTLALCMLHKAKICEVQFTITDCVHCAYVSDVELKQTIHFKLLKIFILNWKRKNQYYGILDESILSHVDLSKSEIIVISRCNLNMSKVIVSKRFKDFFEKHFDVKPQIITEWVCQELGGNVAIMIWNTELTVFDNNFYEKLFDQLKQYFPYHVVSACNESQIPENNDWFYTKPTQNDFTRLEKKLQPTVKRRRLAPQDVILNYDSVCKQKKKIQVSMIFENPIRCPVALSSNSSYLSKITYLNLTGHVVYSTDFYKTLFCCCCNLVTLNSATTPNSAQALGRHIPSSKTMKNLRIAASTIDFKSIFQSLSQCKYLENVYLINETSDPQNLPEPKEMFRKCASLYNLSIFLPMTDSKRTKSMQMLNRLKTMFAVHHLNIELHNSSDDIGLGYDPFIEVFRLNPIKVL